MLNSCKQASPSLKKEAPIAIFNVASKKEKSQQALIQTITCKLYSYLGDILKLYWPGATSSCSICCLWEIRGKGSVAADVNALLCKKSAEAVFFFFIYINQRRCLLEQWWQGRTQVRTERLRKKEKQTKKTIHRHTHECVRTSQLAKAIWGGLHGSA